MPFHTDYRPDDFDQVLGNEGTVKKLRALLKKKTHPQTYLFIGDKGCCKTTLARIIAKVVGCDTEFCLKEVNCANHTQIDHTRQLIDEMNKRPITGKAKVCILDEAHKLSNASQNALLKPTEEPPKHAYWILASTDPQKIIPTLRSRCNTSKVSRLSNTDSRTLIEDIAEDNDCTLKDDVIAKIISRAEGTPRTICILLEDVLALKPKDQLAAIENYKFEEDEAIDLVKAILGKKWPKVAKILKDFKGDPEGMRRLVLAYCSSCLLNRGDNKYALAMEAFREPIMDLGKPGLVMACFDATQGE